MDPTGRVTGASKIARDITHKRLAERVLLTGLRQQSALFRLADELHRSESLEDVYAAGLDATCAAMQCDRASILRYDSDGLMRFIKWRGLSERYRKSVEGHSPWSSEEKRPLPVCVTDVDKADFSEPLKAVLKEEGIRALAFIPLVSGGQLAGKFMTYFDWPHAYTEDEIAISLTIARQIAFAIDRKGADENLRKSEERLRELSEKLEMEVCKRTQELEERNAEVLSRSEQLRELSRKLLRTQDVERRRLARDLHDSAGETLTLLGISLANIKQRAATSSPQFDGQVEQAEQLVDKLSQTIRTTSYLLHPPMLDQVGLPVALTWHVSGLAERSGLDIRLSVPKDFGRLAPDLELMIFRLVQECLSNVYRHSGSKSATITLERLDDNILLKVADEGKGILPEILAAIHKQRAGVGFQGMRERVREAGGEITIESNGDGTKISFILPHGGPNQSER
jgi:signal transduction histidine kinase